MKKEQSEFREKLVAFIPQKVRDEDVLRFFEALAIPVFAMGEDTIAQHKENNDLHWINYQKVYERERFIEHQNSQEMKQLLYGDYDASYNSCEVIAVYNALIELTHGKMSVTFPELLAYFEKRGIALCGLIGTSPYAIRRYFEKLGYSFMTLVGKEITREHLRQMDQQCQTFILMIYNDRNDIMAQVHTVNITKKEGAYTIHNFGGSTRFMSLEEAVEGYNQGRGEPIYIIGIR